MGITINCDGNIKPEFYYYLHLIQSENGNKPFYKILKYDGKSITYTERKKDFPYGDMIEATLERLKYHDSYGNIFQMTINRRYFSTELYKYVREEKDYYWLEVKNS